MTMQAANMAIAKDIQHEIPTLGDHTYLSTTAKVIIQSHKEGFWSYHFWAANTPEVISSCADTEEYYATVVCIQLAPKIH